MPKQYARVNEVLRRRDTLKRARQVWIGGLVVWGVVVGWVLFGFVNSLTDDMDVRITWVLTWLVPVVILAAGALVTEVRLRRCSADLVAVERSR